MQRLLVSCGPFDVCVEEAAEWLARASAHVANSGESALRTAGVSGAEIRATESAFSVALGIAADTEALEQAAAEALAPRKRTRRG